MLHPFYLLITTVWFFCRQQHHCSQDCSSWSCWTHVASLPCRSTWCMSRSGDHMSNDCWENISIQNCPSHQEFIPWGKFPPFNNSFCYGNKPIKLLAWLNGGLTAQLKKLVRLTHLTGANLVKGSIMIRRGGEFAPEKFFLTSGKSHLECRGTCISYEFPFTEQLT